MLGFRPPADRQARREWWLRQIERQDQSRLSVSEFCRRLGVSTVTFYTWKRRFRETQPVADTRPAQPTPPSACAPTAPFLPVSILDVTAAGQLEIEFGNDCVVRVKGTIDPDLLGVAIHAAAQIRSGERGTN